MPKGRRNANTCIDIDSPPKVIAKHISGSTNAPRSSHSVSEPPAISSPACSAAGTIGSISGMNSSAAQYMYALSTLMSTT